MTQKELRKIYDEIEAKRNEHINAVLNCDSKKIVVVAGPGTGKTYLFQKLLEKRGKKSLVLSFVNALVDDLALGLSGMSEVRTLHGYVASYLWHERESKMCPDLPRVIREDAEILLGTDINFEDVFKDSKGKDAEITFFKARKEYYGKYYGYADATYAVVKDIESKRGTKGFPVYEQVLVDEFQDFSPIEVSLIDLLAERSPVLIAGDDDQSLYTRLKDADPEQLRDRYSDRRPDFRSFNLPYCSRCPEVVVDAVNDVVASARAKGLLAKNLKKPYLYFKCKDKDKVSSSNPNILYFQRADNGLPPLLQDQLKEIAGRERKEFSVLVIVPPKLKNLIFKIAASLEKSGFRKLSYPKKKEDDKVPTLYEALKILLDDNDSNLGWRMAARHVLSPSDFAELLKETGKRGSPNVPELLPQAARAKVRKMRATLNSIAQKNDMDDDRLNEFLTETKFRPVKIAAHAVLDDLVKDAASRQTSVRNIRDIPITITTIPGSKGLAADYVFIMYCNEKYIGGKTPSEEDVFNVIVALTRAKKGLVIVSSEDTIPEFVKWIKPERVTLDLMPDYAAMKPKGQAST